MLGDRLRKLFAGTMTALAVYIVPSDMDDLRVKTDTTYDMVFKKLCDSAKGSFLCQNLPSSVSSRTTPMSELSGATNLKVNLRIKGEDTLVFCSDYNNPSTCASYRVDDHTSLRLEIVPYYNIGGYNIWKPSCSTGGPVAVLPFYTQCSVSNQLIDYGSYWRVRTSCVPSNMNVPVLVFCNSWSK